MKTSNLMILDGGMGRELQRIGAPFQQPEWSAQALLEAPHCVSQVHRSFIDAGATSSLKMRMRFSLFA